MAKEHLVISHPAKAAGERFACIPESRVWHSNCLILLLILESVYIVRIDVEDPHLLTSWDADAKGPSCEREGPRENGAWTMIEIFWAEYVTGVALEFPFCVVSHSDGLAVWQSMSPEKRIRSNRSILSISETLVF